MRERDVVSCMILRCVKEGDQEDEPGRHSRMATLMSSSMSWPAPSDRESWRVCAEI
jgi:hypothetical protein